jgi:hypothetical protein
VGRQGDITWLPLADMVNLLSLLVTMLRSLHSASAEYRWLDSGDESVRTISASPCGISIRPCGSLRHAEPSDKALHALLSYPGESRTVRPGCRCDCLPCACSHPIGGWLRPCSRAPAFCEFVWLVTYCGMVWSRHEHPGSCGYHSRMIAMDTRACRPIILGSSRPRPARPRRSARASRRAAPACCLPRHDR